MKLCSRRGLFSRAERAALETGETRGRGRNAISPAPGEMPRSHLEGKLPSRPRSPQVQQALAGPTEVDWAGAKRAKRSRRSLMGDQFPPELKRLAA